MKNLDKKIEWLKPSDFVPVIGIFTQVNRTKNYINKFSMESFVQSASSQILLGVYNAGIIYGLWELLK